MCNRVKLLKSWEGNNNKRAAKPKDVSFTFAAQDIILRELFFKNSTSVLENPDWLFEPDLD
jgi:hypothetical protein